MNSPTASLTRLLRVCLLFSRSVLSLCASSASVSRWLKAECVCFRSCAVVLRLVSQNLYLDGERALCFHGPLIYEAKVCFRVTSGRAEPGRSSRLRTARTRGRTTSSTTRAGSRRALSGGGTPAELISWDEWVPESRLLKLNEENQARQKQLMDAQLAKDRAERDALHAKEKEARHQGGASGTANGTGSRRESGAPRGQKRARESAAATGDPVRRRTFDPADASGGRAPQAPIDQAADPGRAEDPLGRRVGSDHEELAGVSGSLRAV